MELLGRSLPNSDTLHYKDLLKCLLEIQKQMVWRNTHLTNTMLEPLLLLPALEVFWFLSATLTAFLHLLLRLLTGWILHPSHFCSGPFFHQPGISYFNRWPLLYFYNPFIIPHSWFFSVYSCFIIYTSTSSSNANYFSQLVWLYLQS